MFFSLYIWVMKMEKNVKKYEKQINYLLRDVDDFIKDDLKQELTVLLFNIKTTNKKIKNIDNYIFISLKNRKNKFLNEYYKHKCISLNSMKYNYELVDFLEDKIENNNKTYFINNIFYYIKRCLNDKEIFIFEEYFINEKTQKQIAQEMNTSQQCISKKLKIIIKKLKHYYDLNFL